MYISCAVAIGQNQPLVTSPEVWASEITMTEGQLRGKRDTFWETAPAYDGRREIWDALKAACEAVDEGDYDLAQAIVDGANISLPTGKAYHHVALSCHTTCAAVLRVLLKGRALQGVL